MIIILKPNNKNKHERRDQGIKDQDQSDEGECLNPKPIPRPLTSNHTSACNNVPVLKSFAAASGMHFRIWRARVVRKCMH